MKKYAEGSPMEEAHESPAEEMKEAPSEHELDMHHDTLMKAEAIKGNAGLMKHLKPHMAKKAMHMKSVMGQMPESDDGKIKSIDGLKKAYRKKTMEG